MDDLSEVEVNVESEVQINAESDKVCISVTDKLHLVSISAEKSDFDRTIYNSIARVPKHLRDVNEKSYEPQIVAIGPYHRGRNQHHLEMMEEHKVRYLKMLIARTREGNVVRYVNTLRKLEGRARETYADVVKLSENDFVEMMLLDACFIVELFRGKALGPISIQDKPFLHLRWIRVKLIRDLLLVENQLPFFVLEEFFEMTKMPNETNNFFQIILDFFEYRFLMYGKVPCTADNENFHHLLNFVHEHLFYELRPYPSICGTEGTERHDREVIRCATELQEAGIEFKMVKGKHLFHIRFENGTMKVPRLTIEEDTESFFRNLIVYEQYHPKEENLIIDYIKFMDCLINSAKDVELLCQRKIIHNCLGDDEVVANLFNRLCDSVTMSSGNYYKDIYSNVNRHCSRRQNRWMASLRHNYFNTPWALISFIAAALLLLFTLIQTVFSVAAYFK